MRPFEVPTLGGGVRHVDLAALGVDPSLHPRLLLIPSLVDLVCDPGFPGFPVRETPHGLGAAAAAGGFGELLLSPRVDPVVDTPEHLSRVARAFGLVRVHFAAALTVGLAGKELTEAGLLLRAGAAALSDGGLACESTLVLRNALEYAREFGAVVLHRPADAALDAVGVANDSPVAVRLGLRGNPAATEEIGVGRAIALARATGARVHLTHIGTARSVELIAAAQREGIDLTASTPVRNLLLDETTLDDGRYDSRLRLHPPLRTADDRLALVQAVRGRVLWLAADHQPRAPEEKDHEFERAVPGSVGLRTAFAAALHALGSVPDVVEALALGPRRLLGLDVASWALIDPQSTTPIVNVPRSDALAEVELGPGRVLALVE